MNEHKHASVLRAIASGVPIDEFEAHNSHYKEFLPLRECFATDRISNQPADGWITHPDKWEIRRKPQYIMVNGFKVPKPLEGLENTQRVYTPALMDNQMSVCWYEPPNIATAVSRGIAHTTKEAAIAHAKAMLGIDPKWEE